MMRVCNEHAIHNLRLYIASHKLIRFYANLSCFMPSNDLKASYIGDVT